MSTSFIFETECSYNRTLTFSPVPRPCIAPAGGFLSLQLFIKSEHPRRANFEVNFDRSIANRPYRASLNVDYQDRLIQVSRVRLPNRITPVFFPDRLQLEIGDIKYRSKLPMFELLSEEQFFEYLVTKQIEKIGFQCDWLNKDKRDHPNILSILKANPPPDGEVFQVECVHQGPYTQHQLDFFYEKHQDWKNRMNPNFSRLVLVPLHTDISSEYYDYAHEKSISVITYPMLVQLVKQVDRGIIERHRAYELLQRPGEVRISQRISVNANIPDTIKITYSFKFS